MGGHRDREVVPELRLYRRVMHKERGVRVVAEAREAVCLLQVPEALGPEALIVLPERNARRPLILALTTPLETEFIQIAGSHDPGVACYQRRPRNVCVASLIGRAAAIFAGVPVALVRPPRECILRPVQLHVAADEEKSVAAIVGKDPFILSVEVRAAGLDAI